MHVDDLAEACIFALENWDPNSGDSPKDKYGDPLYFLNVGTGKDISIKELAYIISENIGFKGKIFWDKTKPDGVSRKFLDNTLIAKTGWVPRVGLMQGVEYAYMDFKKKN